MTNYTVYSPRATHAGPIPSGSIVQLLARRENILDIAGVDVLDNTPLLDIKPYVPEFDERTGGRTGWYANRNIRE